MHSLQQDVIDPPVIPPLAVMYRTPIRALFLALLINLTACTGPDDPVIAFESMTASSPATNHASTGSVNVIDVDGDGDLDVYESNGYDVSAEDPRPQQNLLHLNDGNARFTLTEGSGLDAPHGYSSGSIWGDYDNDGDLDVYIPNQQGPNTLLKNDGGKFTPVENVTSTDSGSSYSATWVDIDGDGWLDLYVGNGGLSHIETNAMYRNLGDGQFERVFNTATSDSVGTLGDLWADFNGDLLPDLYVPNVQGTNYLYLNRGNWEFDREEYPLSQDAQIFRTGSAAAADFDNDGDMDIAQTRLMGGHDILLINDGSGRFTEAPSDALSRGGSAYGATWFDADNDGWLDLLVWTWSAENNFYRNNQGTLEAADILGFAHHVMHTSSAAAADLDGDGLLDLMMGTWPNHRGPYENNHLLLNRSQGTGNWVGVRIDRDGPNSFGVGSVIEVHAGGIVQTRQIATQTSWRSQGPLSIHVGVGQATTIDRIVVRSAGADDVERTDVPINQVLTISE